MSLTRLSLTGDGLMAVGAAVILVRPMELPLVMSGLIIFTLGPLFGHRIAEMRGIVTRKEMIESEISWVGLSLTACVTTLVIWGRRYLRGDRASDFSGLVLMSAPVLATLVFLLVGGLGSWFRKQPLTGKPLGVVLLVAAAVSMAHYSLIYFTGWVLLGLGLMGIFGGIDPTADFVARFILIVEISGLTIFGGRIVAQFVSKHHDLS